jgi:hypothetical protein
MYDYFEKCVENSQYILEGLSVENSLAVFAISLPLLSLSEVMVVLKALQCFFIC